MIDQTRVAFGDFTTVEVWDIDQQQLIFEKEIGPVDGLGVFNGKLICFANKRSSLIAIDLETLQSEEMLQGQVPIQMFKCAEGKLVIIREDGTVEMREDGLEGAYRKTRLTSEEKPSHIIITSQKIALFQLSKVGQGLSKKEGAHTLPRFRLNIAFLAWKG